MSKPPRCAVAKCKIQTWANTPFCFDHLIRHVERALRPDEQQRLAEKLDSVLRTLTYKEREVLRLRYGVSGDGFTYTREEVGRIFKVAPSTIARVEQKAFRKLRHPARIGELNEFLSMTAFAPPDDITVEAVRVCNAELLRHLRRHPDHLFKLAPENFEKVVAEILASFGFKIELTQRTRDGGRDIIAVGRSQIGIDTKYIVECKRYSKDNPVRVELVRSLYGVKCEQRADHAILTTTSYFTEDAIRFSKSPHVWNLHLRDFQAIQEWLKTYEEMMSKGAILL